MSIRLKLMSSTCKSCSFWISFGILVIPASLRLKYLRWIKLQITLKHLLSTCLKPLKQSTRKTGKVERGGNQWNAWRRHKSAISDLIWHKFAADKCLTSSSLLVWRDNRCILPGWQLLVMYCCQETILICQACDEIKYHIMYSTNFFIFLIWFFYWNYGIIPWIWEISKLVYCRLSGRRNSNFVVQEDEIHRFRPFSGRN